MAASAFTRSRRLTQPMSTAITRQKTIATAYAAPALPSAGIASESSQAVPTPPKPEWEIPSPMNAQRRRTTSTERRPHATPSAHVVTTALR